LSYNIIISPGDIKKTNSMYFRLARTDRHSKQKKNIMNAKNILLRISDILKLSNNIKELAMYLCKKGFKEKLVRGRTIENLVIACLYYAIRKLSIPITFKEIASENERYIKIMYKKLISTFNLKLPVVNPLIFASRYIRELVLDFNFERKVSDIIQKIPSIVKSGLNPIVLCATIIYLISKAEQVNLSQKKISKITGITETSIRNNVKRIKQYL